jgi:hypothetical protein
MAMFRKKPPTTPGDARPAMPHVEWDLGQLVGRVRDAAPALEARDVDAALVQARFADRCRDAGLAPPEAAEFERQVEGLDVEGWRRLALAAAALDDAALWAGLAGRDRWVPVADGVAIGLPRLARSIAPLTVALVRQSAVRAEEFARHLTMSFGIGIVGETGQQSLDRLYALDYRRLLAEAEQAREAAQEKMERLRKKQQEFDGARRRRGKW